MFCNKLPAKRETQFLKNDYVFNRFQEDPGCSYKIKAECQREGQFGLGKNSMGREKMKFLN